MFFSSFAFAARPAVRAAFGCLYQRRQILATTTYGAWLGKAERAMRENHRTGHESMVGPCGLEPQTSTVSIWRPHDYRPLLKATKCKCVNEMASLWNFHDSQSHVVNFGAKTRSMLNCVFNSVAHRGGRPTPRRRRLISWQTPRISSADTARSASLWSDRPKRYPMATPRQ